MNEKKAYFEAHFRKKLLLQQSLSDEDTGMEHQNGEQDSLESMGHGEEVLVTNKDSHSCHFDESLVSSECGGGESEVTSNYVQESRTAELPIEIDVEVAAKSETNTEQGPECDRKEEVSSEVISLSRNSDTTKITSRTGKKRLPPKVQNEFH